MGTRYALPHRLLHWGIAILILLSLASGMTLGFLGFEGAMERFGQAGTDFVYTYHKTLGVTILGLMVLRLISRLVFGKPAYEQALPPAQKWASSAVHVALYVLLFTMPVLGWLATASGGYPVQFFQFNLPGLIGRDPALSETLFAWHGRVGWLILVLAVIHISAALYHWKVRRDGVMQRMSLLGGNR